ncbi:MAG: hypothetical protein GSR80_000125 [Desulfurococcales archaeon]|nr:hypothetical protein [Desulfurococcales archaeon]
MGDPIIPNGKHTCSNVKLRLARRLCIESLMKDNAFILLIEGQTGAGKSTLALKLARALLGEEGDPLDYLIFTPFELEEKVEAAQSSGRKYPLLVWDDAGPWMQLIKRYPYDPLAVAVVGHIETMRTWTGLLILTMTTERHLPRAIYDNGYIYRYRVNVWKNYYDEERGTWQAEALLHERKRRQDGRWYWETSREWLIRFWHFRPGDPLYERYSRLRLQYARVYNEVMEAAKRFSRASVSLVKAHEAWKAIKQRMG